MNKLTVGIIGGVVVIVGVSAIFIARNSSTDDATVSDMKTGKSETIKLGDNAVVAVDACSVLTEAVAKNILGEGAEKADLSAAGQTSTKDVSVSNCVYTAKIDPTAAVRMSNTKGVSLLIRSGKTKDGTDSNKGQFGSQKPTGVQDVAGLGEAAYFNPQFGQLNVLKNGNWYIISNYSGTVGSGTAESGQVLAKALGM